MIRKAIVPMLIMAVGVFGAANVSAQAKKPASDKLTSKKVSKETIGAWAVQCTEVTGQKKRCNLAQRLIQRKTQRTIASWVISKAEDGKLMAAVTVPAGVSVPEGLTMAIGEVKLPKLPYRTCLKSSCVASFELTSANLAEMGRRDKVVFTADSLSKKKINIQFSLKGFSQAFKVYQGETG